MKKPKIRLILATAALFRLFTVTAFSLELSLEENRGEKGSVGYVDIERVFKESPETLRAKDDFQSQIQKKEKLLNEKKSALFALKADLSRLKQEREFAARLPMLTEPSPAPPVPEPAGISTSAIMTELSASSPSAAAQTESVMTPSQSAEISTAAIMTELLASSHTTAQAESVIAPGAPPVASQPEQPQIFDSLPGMKASLPQTLQSSAATQTEYMDLPGIKNVPADRPRISTASLSLLDSSIKIKEDEITEKELQLRGFQRQVERELLDYESRKTEIILGKIYQMIREIAVSEGISVVVDKRSILYGQSAVDLTDKLVKKMRSF